MAALPCACVLQGARCIAIGELAAAAGQAGQADAYQDATAKDEGPAAFKATAFTCLVDTSVVDQCKVAAAKADLWCRRAQISQGRQGQEKQRQGDVRQCYLAQECRGKQHAEGSCCRNYPAQAGGAPARVARPPAQPLQVVLEKEDGLCSEVREA